MCGDTSFCHYDLGKRLILLRLNFGPPHKYCRLRQIHFPLRLHAHSLACANFENSAEKGVCFADIRAERSIFKEGRFDQLTRVHRQNL